MKRSKYGTTVATRVCCSMISDTQTRYAVTCCHGRCLRPWCRIQSRTRAAKSAAHLRAAPHCQQMSKPARPLPTTSADPGPVSAGRYGWPESHRARPVPPRSSLLISHTQGKLSADSSPGRTAEIFAQYRSIRWAARASISWRARDCPVLRRISASSRFDTFRLRRQSCAIVPDGHSPRRPAVTHRENSKQILPFGLPPPSASASVYGPACRQPGSRRPKVPDLGGDFTLMSDKARACRTWAR